MRTVVDAPEVAHLWAHKAQDRAKSKGRSNFYFEGDTIYSYGSHFPIARHIKNKRGDEAILFTTRGYSVTTSGHKSMARGAIPRHVRVFDVVDVLDHPNAKTLDEIQARIVEATIKAERARNNKEWRLNERAAEIEQFKALAAFIGSKREPKLLTAPEWEKEQKRKAAIEARKAEKERAERERKATEERARLKIEQREQFEAWLEGGDVYFPHAFRHEGDYLRIKDGEVETSQSANVPVKHVTKVAPLILGLIEHSKTYQRNGHSIHLGPYVIDSLDNNGTLTVGCHEFKKEEIIRFAKVLQERKLLEGEQLKIL